jgi:hypothetical protein
MIAGNAFASSAPYFRLLIRLAATDTLPPPLVVLRVREDVFDEDFLVSIVYFRNQAVVIAFDIEDRASPYGVSVPKSRARLREVTPVGFPRQFVPLFQRRLGIGMCFPELAQSPFTDDSHSAIPFNGYTRILRALGQAWAPTDLKARRSRSKHLYRLLTAGPEQWRRPRSLLPHKN